MTTTADKSLQKVLNESNLNYLPTVFQLMKLGNMLGGEVKVVATGLTAAASFDITTSAVRAASTITGLDRNTTDALPAIAVVRSLRVTASGTANSVGSYAITDASGAAVSPTAGANVGLATLSDDGKTLTFPTTVTAFTLTYMPKPHTDLDTVFKQMGL